MSARQLTMFGARPRLLGPDDDASGGAGDRPEGTPELPGIHDGQIDLFAQPAVLGREMEASLAAGRFELASRLRRILDDTYGPSLLTRGLDFLERLGTCPWDGPPAEALSIWDEIDGRLAERAHHRDQVRMGVFARLLASHTPEALVEARPGCLPALATALAAGLEGTPEASQRRARGLVRDALLAGRDLASLDFERDAAVADLLAENLPPQWLACLGLVRRLWSAPRPNESDFEGFRSTSVEVPSPEEAALEFWWCLQVAECADCAEERLHEARRRMKQLSPDLHALYMRRARVILTASAV